MKQIIDFYRTQILPACKTFFCTLADGIWRMIRNPKLKRRMLVVVGAVVALLLLAFAFSGVILRSYLEKKVTAAQEKYGLSVDYSDIRAVGLNGVRIQGLSITPVDRDTLFKAKSIEVEISLWRLMMMRIRVTHLEAEQINVQFIKQDSLSNFDFMYRNNTENQEDSISSIELQRNYGREADRMIEFLFGLLPSNAQVDSLNVLYRNQGYEVAIHVPSLTVADTRFRAQIETSEAGKTQHWISEGTLQNRQRTIQGKLFDQDGKPVQLPFLEYRWDARVQFDTLAFELSQTQMRQGVLELMGKASVVGLTVFQPRISPEDVFLDRGVLDYKINVGERRIELDSITQVRFNKLSFNPYLSVERNEQWRVRASVNKQNFLADDLFSSLPKGLFYNLEGIKTEGKLSYHFLFDVDFARVDSLRFESALESDGFKILKYGNTDLRKMNGPFTYTAYDNGAPVRSFELGPENPNFRPLESISPLLQMAVMQSEDGAFFYHGGFLIDCIREALVQDIKVKRFARGGSTISMQLIKNIFLSRNKTIARKLEEALIVWMIESKRLTSKQRMYEVYLNIVEWGPLVYGANEAAHYYFAKEASALNANEAIFLASIIPRPKGALNSFTDSLTLKPRFEGYYRILAGRLKIKGVITEEEAEKVRPDIVVAGAARADLLRRAELKAQAENDDDPLEEVPLEVAAESKVVVESVVP